MLKGTVGKAVNHTKTAEEKNWKQDLNKLLISKSLNLLKIPDDFLTM